MRKIGERERRRERKKERDRDRDRYSDMATECRRSVNPIAAVAVRLFLCAFHPKMLLYFIWCIGFNSLDHPSFLCEKKVLSTYRLPLYMKLLHTRVYIYTGCTSALHTLALSCSLNGGTQSQFAWKACQKSRRRDSLYFILQRRYIFIYIDCKYIYCK